MEYFQTTVFLLCWWELHCMRLGHDPIARWIKIMQMKKRGMDYEDHL